MQVEIAKYALSIAGSPTAGNPIPARINASGSNNERFQIRFHNSEKEIPPDKLEGQLFVVNMPVSLLGNVVDILRNEKPVYLTRGQDGRSYLCTDLEEVGVNETPATAAEK